MGTRPLSVGDHVEERCAVGFPEAVGPFWVKGAGHLMPWERPTTVNRAIRTFSADLLKT